jgi:uncharacterized protein YidB (DUF937 family)
MGILETLTGLFRSSGVQDSLVKSVGSMFADGKINLGSIKEQADKAGLGDIFDSWVGTGENKPITADQVKQMSNPENLQKIADDAGMSVDQAAEELSKALPDVVDKVTPDGVIPSDADVKSALGAS